VTVRLCARLAFAASLAISAPAVAQAQVGVDKLSHILVLYLENRSFDNLFGQFPKANGIANAGPSATQLDRNGEAYKYLPAARHPFDEHGNPAPVRAIPALDGLSNEPFVIPGTRDGLKIDLDTFTKSPTHLFYTSRTQINGGKNDLFAAYSEVGALVMGYYDANSMKDTRLWKLASQHRLLDRFFMGAFGGSFLNHQWLVCTCSPVWRDPPHEYRSMIETNGRVVTDSAVTAAGDGDHAVNTVQSIFLNDGKQGQKLLPAQTATTIGDRLSEKGVDWAWYSGGWDLANNPHRSEQQEAEFNKKKFQWHHQPFAYYQRFSPLTESGRRERELHLRDASRLEADIRSGELPPVAFYKPVGVLNQHPGYASLVPGDEEVGAIVKAMQESPMKRSFAVVITFDENGGFWDHVAPPSGAKAGSRADFFGPGSRVPTIIVSPFAHQGVEPIEFETTSILKLIGERHRLDPMPSARYGAVESLAKAFDFGP
jgi:phospholipase C